MSIWMFITIQFVVQNSLTYSLRSANMMIERALSIDGWSVEIV